jgi:hypothetical protein
LPDDPTLTWSRLGFDPGARRPPPLDKGRSELWAPVPDNVLCPEASSWSNLSPGPPPGVKLLGPAAAAGTSPGSLRWPLSPLRAGPMSRARAASMASRTRSKPLRRTMASKRAGRRVSRLTFTCVRPALPRAGRSRARTKPLVVIPMDDKPSSWSRLTYRPSVRWVRLREGTGRGGGRREGGCGWGKFH